MYQTKRIHYKSIFKQDGHNDTIEYKTNGIVCIDEDTHIQFQDKDVNIYIKYGEFGVMLKNGDSCLYFDYEKEKWNEYKLPYGSVSLKTKLLSFEANEDRIKMKYELYDTSALISTVYILITLMPFTYQEEL